MIQRKGPTLSCAGIGTLCAAISRKSALHQANGGKIESQSAMPGQKYHLMCTAFHHAAARFAHHKMQP